MGHKVNPIGFRLAVDRGWRSKWFAKGKDFADNLMEDYKIRELISIKSGPQAAISRVIIEKGIGRLSIIIYTAKPGVLIGRGGKQLESLRNDLTKLLTKKFKLDVVEIKKADLDANVVAQSIAMQISKRMPYRRATKQAVMRVMTAGAKGVRATIAGRLDGAEIARRETFTEGSVPLTTLRNDIDFASYHAKTTYGIVGIKIWINKGERI
jgi:small subunit ribosomal protein S3